MHLARRETFVNELLLLMELFQVPSQQTTSRLVCGSVPVLFGCVCSWTGALFLPASLFRAISATGRIEFYQ